MCFSKPTALFVLSCLLHFAAAGDPNIERTQIKVVLQQPLKTPSPDVTATTVLLYLPPGDVGSPPHTHPGPVTGYVIQGEFLFQANNGTERILKAGDAFYEDQGTVHVWSANASNLFVCKVVATVMGITGEPILTPLANYPRISRDEALRRARGKKPN